MVYFSLRFLVGKVMEKQDGCPIENVGHDGGKDGCPITNVGDGGGESRQKNCAHLLVLHLGIDPSPWVQDDGEERMDARLLTSGMTSCGWMPDDACRICRPSSNLTVQIVDADLGRAWLILAEC